MPLSSFNNSGLSARVRDGRNHIKRLLAAQKEQAAKTAQPSPREQKPQTPTVKR